MNNQNIVIMFERISPYHWARINFIGKQKDIFAIENYVNDKTYQWEKYDKNGSFHRITLFKDENDARNIFNFRKKIIKILFEIKPSVVAICGWSDNSSLIAIEWCITNKIPTIIMSDTYRPFKKNLIKEYIKKRLIRYFNSGFVAGSPHLKYLVSLGMKPEKISLGYDTVDNEHFFNKANLTRLNFKQKSKELNLPERYFLCVARFIPEKNLFNLLDAYKKYKIKMDNKAWTLVILGDGILKDSIQKRIEKLELSREIIMPGFKQYDELPYYYGLANCFILPSVSETWGLVVNEAMASGLPVLVSKRCGCAEDLVKEGINGFTFDPYNVEELCSLMIRMSNGELDLKAMGKASEGIIKNWGLDRFADGFWKAVENALQTKRPECSIIDRLILKGLIYK